MPAGQFKPTGSGNKSYGIPATICSEVTMRRANGSSFIELAAGLMIIIPLVLYVIDAATIYFGASMNASVGRDAARAAAAGAPSRYCRGGTSDPLRPRKRAESVIARSSNPQSIVRVEPVFLFAEELRPPYPIAPWGGPVKGRVVVRTTTTVNPPFKLPFVQKIVTLNNDAEYPFTWVMPANYTIAAPPAGAPPPGGVPPATDDDADEIPGHGGMTFGG